MSETGLFDWTGSGTGSNTFFSSSCGVNNDATGWIYTPQRHCAVSECGAPCHLQKNLIPLEKPDKMKSTVSARCEKCEINGDVIMDRNCGDDERDLQKFANSYDYFAKRWRELNK